MSDAGEQPDLNALSLLEALLEAPDPRRELPSTVKPWGGPTLSRLWPPSDPRAEALPADLDSTAWHFKLNRMPIPSAVTNRFLSNAPLAEPYSSACKEPCRADRLPRLYAGGGRFDLLAALNFASGLDETDALNQQVQSAVQTFRARLDPSDIEWSVHPEAARLGLMALYDGEASSDAIDRFIYRRELPSGASVEITNDRIAQLLGQREEKR